MVGLSEYGKKLELQSSHESLPKQLRSIKELIVKAMEDVSNTIAEYGNSLKEFHGETKGLSFEFPILIEEMENFKNSELNQFCSSKEGYNQLKQRYIAASANVEKSENHMNELLMKKESSRKNSPVNMDKLEEDFQKRSAEAEAMKKELSKFEVNK